ncbi:hypothetical protein BJV77DRAFT_84234 [Russula vinacea]|nr:hypothetical protein BJV77DRAFT_84234 [Russula vinacea]
MMPGCGRGHSSQKATWKGMALPRWKRDLFPKLNATASVQPIQCIHQLPVELLQKIFTCLAEPRLPDHDPFMQIYPEWISITYVCRYWRAVALGHHSLWGTITPNLSLTWLKVLWLVPNRPRWILSFGSDTFPSNGCVCASTTPSPFFPGVPESARSGF